VAQVAQVEVLMDFVEVTAVVVEEHREWVQMVQYPQALVQL
jgi:hypothetical protein